MLHVPASADTAELKARESSTSQASLEFLSSLLTCNKMRQTERRRRLNFCSEASQKGTETRTQRSEVFPFLEQIPRTAVNTALSFRANL